MAQDVWQYGTAEGAPEQYPDGKYSDGKDQDEQDRDAGRARDRKGSRRAGLALLVCLLVLAGAVTGLVLFLAPWANAVGGCGGAVVRP
jgi:hypothetical protein